MNHAVLAVLHPEQVEVEIWRSDELEVRRGLSSELDEMGSFVKAKAHPRWLWHAIDHHTGKVLAYVFGRRKDTVFLRLQELLEPFGITKYYTDGWGAYERHLDAEQHHVGKKAEPRWLWHAIDHHRGTVLAYVFGQRKDAVFLQLQALLEPFGITRFYTDGWGAYARHIDSEQHHVGKEHTQKIASKHINLRTRIKRLVRRTICFSKTTTMHDLVIGLFINRYELGVVI